jgi:chaperone modulatory protein CbpM
VTAPSRLPELTLSEVALRCEVELTFVEQLLELGIIEPVANRSQVSREVQFSREITLRVQRCVRLQRDLGVNLEGAAVILQLLDQIESLEQQLRGLRRG